MNPIENLLGIKIIESPNLPKGHLGVLNGDQLSILYPEVYKSFKFLNKLAPNHFNQTSIKSYGMVDLGSVNLMPRHHLEIPEPPTEKDRILTRFTEIFRNTVY